MRKAFAVTLAMVVAVGLLSACAENRVEDEVGGLEADLESSQPEEEKEKTPSQMKTEEELREGLEELRDKPDTQAARLVFYEELLARDMCREDDYLEMARLYADIGDAAAQRRMLWWGFRLYPSENFAYQLQELVIQRTEDEETVKELITVLQQLLAEQDAAALRTVIKSEEWKEIFQEAPELYATRTRYSAGNLAGQIVSDAYETKVFLFGADGGCLYGCFNDAGSLIASAVYADGAYNGDADVCWFDGEDILYKRYQVTLDNDVCVNSVSVEYEGISYSGALGEDGSVTEKQQEKVTQAGGVVYAYQAGGNRYLYQEDAAIDTFRIDYMFIGLPQINIWE